MRRGSTLAVRGLLLLMAAAASYGVLRAAYGERPAYVHVRWATAVDTAERERLEQVHGLTRPELREGRTWGYYLANLSSTNIQGLVTNPAVEDTHYLHRTAFRVWRTAPRAPYPGTGPVWMASLLEFLTRAFVALGGLAVIVGGFRAWRTRAAPSTGAL